MRVRESQCVSVWCKIVRFIAFQRRSRLESEGKHVRPNAVSKTLSASAHLTQTVTLSELELKTALGFECEAAT